MLKKKSQTYSGGKGENLVDQQIHQDPSSGEHERLVAVHPEDVEMFQTTRRT